MTKRASLHTAVFALLPVIALACGGAGQSHAGSASSSSPATFDQIVAKAKQEGQLTVYISTANSVNKAEFDGFNKEYPFIKITATRLASGQLTARYASEKESGAPSADIINVADDVMIGQHPEWFAKIPTSLPNLKQVPSKFRTADYVTIGAGPFVMTSNTRKLAEQPTSWKDLADPKYKGQGEVDDPRSESSILAAYAHLRDLYGDSYLKALAHNFAIYGSNATAIQQLGAGQYGIVGPGQSAHSQALRASGAPLKVDQMTPTMGLTHLVAVNSAAEHPNAAFLFTNWLLSANGQEAACAGQDRAITTSSLSDCPVVPSDFFIVNDAAGQAQKAAILADFNVS